MQHGATWHLNALYTKDINLDQHLFYLPFRSNEKALIHRDTARAWRGEGTLHRGATHGNARRAETEEYRWELIRVFLKE